MLNRLVSIVTLLAVAAAISACGGDVIPLDQRQPGSLPLTPEAPTADPQAWQPVALDEFGLALQAPPGWQSLEDGGYWSPAGGERLSASVQALPIGAPLWNTFLPADEFDVLESRSFASGVGMGEYLVIAVYRSVRQTTPHHFEMHILVNSGDHPAVDFSASAPTLEAVESLRPAVERLAAEAGWK